MVEVEIMSETENSKMKAELNTELENESYKVQIKELELDGRYLFIRGIILDVDKKDASEFEESIDMSDFCCNDSELESEQEEQDIETSVET